MNRKPLEKTINTMKSHVIFIIEWATDFKMYYSHQLYPPDSCTKTKNKDNKHYEIVYVAPE